MTARRSGREVQLASWTSKARRAATLAADEPWPAWSTGELLAVALILHDTDMLAALDYSRDEALERLRYEIGEPTRAAAAAVFEELRAHVLGQVVAGDDRPADGGDGC